MTSIEKTLGDFWKGRRVLVTGHTGFKGSWLTLWLSKLGAQVSGYSLAPDTVPSNFSLIGVNHLVDSYIGDIRDAGAFAKACSKDAPEIVFHLAAQALVRRSYQDPLETWSTNVVGTATVLDVLRNIPSVKSIVVITTDKVYDNEEWEYPYRESDPLGGHDPYSASKAGSELVAQSYRKSFFYDKQVGLATARAGNVIGGGDWSVDRLVPDAVKAWQTAETLRIRNPGATRPWQHVIEPLFGYLQLAQKLFRSPLDFASAWNFGPPGNDVLTVEQIIQHAQLTWPGHSVEIETTIPQLHEARILKLESARSNSLLGFRSVWNAYRAVEITFEWYKSQYQGASARELCLHDIERWCSDFSLQVALNG